MHLFRVYTIIQEKLQKYSFLNFYSKRKFCVYFEVYIPVRIASSLTFALSSNREIVLDKVCVLY
jgi:hypothetical protein